MRESSAWRADCLLPGDSKLMVPASEKHILELKALRFMLKNLGEREA